MYYVVYTCKTKGSVCLSDDPLCQNILSLLENQHFVLFISRQFLHVPFCCCIQRNNVKILN